MCVRACVRACERANEGERDRHRTVCVCVVCVCVCARARVHLKKKVHTCPLPLDKIIVLHAGKNRPRLSYRITERVRKHSNTWSMLLLSWCLMSSDVIWHIRDKLWPMPKHGSIRKVYACLAVTCHLHFWQNDRDFLRATAVTRGWNVYRNKSQHRKSTLEKKILPPFQQGFEPATFQSRVRLSNHWAIPAPHTWSIHDILPLWSEGIKKEKASKTRSVHDILPLWSEGIKKEKASKTRSVHDILPLWSKRALRKKKQAKFQCHYRAGSVKTATYWE